MWIITYSQWIHLLQESTVIEYTVCDKLLYVVAEWHSEFVLKSESIVKRLVGRLRSSVQVDTFYIYNRLRNGRFLCMGFRFLKEIKSGLMKCIQERKKKDHYLLRQLIVCFYCILCLLLIFTCTNPASWLPHLNKRLSCLVNTLNSLRRYASGPWAQFTKNLTTILR